MGSGKTKHKTREKYIPAYKRKKRFKEVKKEPPKKEDVNRLLEMWKQNIKKKKEK